jgi:uncharacterized protein (TIGR00730 family)
MPTLTNLCVYCGSRAGRHPAYAEGARQLGYTLADRDIGLVYGGAHVGLMGIVADAVLERGGRAVGVIPGFMQDRELAHTGLTALHVTRTMHERKALMAELSDGFIALPGGVGTLEELFEIWTWAQIGVHSKPCGLLNVAGYYHQLSAFLDHAFAEGFVREPHHDLLLMDEDPARLVTRLAEFEAPPQPPRPGTGPFQP